MIIKIVIGIFLYLIALVIICKFFKEATRLGNEMDDKREVERIIEELKRNKESGGTKGRLI